jgi:hypothetical protein
VLRTLESGISESLLYDGMREVTYKEYCSLIDFTTIICCSFCPILVGKDSFFVDVGLVKYRHESRMMKNMREIVKSSKILMYMPLPHWKNQILNTRASQTDSLKRKVF